MRLLGRLIRQPIRSLLHVSLVALLLTITTACSLPEVSVEKRQKHIDDSKAGYSKPDGLLKSDHVYFVDQNYLATVQVRFSDSKNASVMTFDIRRDKRRRIAFNLWNEENITSFVHLGYTRSDGAIGGIRFSWRF